MMILSRIWYLILALFVSAALYVSFLAVGQYNRRNQAAMDEMLKSDSQAVKWGLDIDARRRLDALYLASVDPGVAKAIKAANGKDAIPSASKEEGSKALRNFNEKLPPEYKSDVLFLADREGRLVAQVGYDAVQSFPDFELGGYPAVFDALHGFFRDDTWVWGGKIARVVARPVEDEAGQAPVGAVIGMRWVDKSFATDIGKRTRTNIAFFALGQLVSSAALDGFEETSLQALDPKAAVTHESFKENNGRTDVLPLTDEKGGYIFVRMIGDASELGTGFAVARPKVAIGGPMGFLQGADDQDKKNVKLWLIAVIAFGGALIGLLFSWLEHTRPMNTLASEAGRLKKGEIDVLSVPRFRGGYRPIATDINAGIQRVVEKGGGQARKPADLESILGPVPAQPNMSAFSFPLPDGSAPPQQAPAFPGAANGPPSPAAGPRPPGAPPPPGSRPQAPLQHTMALPNAPGPPFGGGLPASASGPAAAAPPPKPAPAAAPPPAAFPPGGPAVPKLAKEKEETEEEQTMVAQPSADLISAATGEHSADPLADWQKVYEEFIKTKRECGEPTDGLTFEKFQQTLKKNRDALIQRHGCKRVKFSVYVKEGRASLKATPVRE